MKPRDIFIKACNEIAIPFIAMGFKPSKNGQCLKKISKDKNLTFEIWFRSSVYNSSCSVAIYPLITITCKNLKKWVQEENLNVNDDGLVYHNHIGSCALHHTDKNRDWPYESRIQDWIPIANKSISILGSCRTKLCSINKNNN